MKNLQEHLLVPVDDSFSRRQNLSYAPNEYVKIQPFAFSYARLVLYCLLVPCSAFILLIVSVWFPQVFTRMARRPLPFSAAGEADYMLVLVHEDGMRSIWAEEPVHRGKMDGEAHPKLSWTWFEFKKHRYVFNYERCDYERYLATVKEDLEPIRARGETGLDAATVDAQRELYGVNLVGIDKPNILMLIFVKLVHPFYLFQVFSATVWFFQDYTIYAIVVLVLSAASMSWEIYSEVSNSNRLRELVRSNQVVPVLRSNAHGPAKLHETELVPGDIVDITTGLVCADMLLLSGACVADESSLTGEAFPINKEPAMGNGVLTDAIARVQYKTSMLHSGSTITQLREGGEPIRGVVLSTGFSTGKGELFRSILYPKPITFAFEQDSYRYLAILATVALIAFVKRMIQNAGNGTGFFMTLINSLDLFTIAVPPALPLVLSSGIGFALNRLLARGIFCIDSQRINSCGQLSCFCFDKTGTLTQEHLNLIGVDVVSANRQLEHVGLVIPRMMQLAMATCHGLSEHEGKLQGYALDMSMFEACGYSLEYLHNTKSDYVAIVTSKNNSQLQYGIVRRFPFDASRQLASVVVEDLATKKRTVIVKGSPEAINGASISMPENFHFKTLWCAAEGYYCIGFAFKELDESSPIDLDNRDEVECGLHFDGLALFKNELKPESKGMLEELYEAQVDVRIITGDNALTAVHVCRELEMKLKPKVAVVDLDTTGALTYHCVDAIKESTEELKWELFTQSNMTQVMEEYDLAVTGAAINKILEDEFDEASIGALVRHTVIFARIKPMQKTWIVEQLMDQGHIVGMCGDGTNDCGALKAAHVGLALSSAEASIVAPFTSKAKDIMDVPLLLREGRCALTTSFLGFKFMMLYPVIQLFMASTLDETGIHAGVELLLSNNQYMWDDMGIVLGLAITMLYTASSGYLSRERPPLTLFSLTIMGSILGQVIIFLGLFFLNYYIMTKQSWFCSCKHAVEYQGGDMTYASTCYPLLDLDIEDDSYAFEDTVVWLYGHMGYIAVAIAFNMKDPFRLPFYTNRVFTVLLTAVLAVNVYFLLDTSGNLMSTFQVLPVPESFRGIMLALFIANIVLAVAWEYVATRVLPKAFNKEW